jgi:hypothetical protein
VISTLASGVGLGVTVGIGLGVLAKASLGINKTPKSITVAKNKSIFFMEILLGK